MSLIRKGSTPAMIVANRANSRKSTGPQTELGKGHASRNAGKHLVYAGVSPATMRDLGEDPAEFEKLRQSWRGAIGPRDGFEEKLVEDMAANRWRLARLHRAETGILAVQQMKLENIVRQGPVRTGPSYDNIMIHYQGLAGVSESHEKYVQILRVLLSLSEKVEREGFCAEGLKLLETVYGSSPGVTGVGLISQYKTQLESEKGEPQTENDGERKAARQDFLENLTREMEAFAQHAKVIQLAKDTPLPESIKDAQLLPVQEDLDRIMRYEAHLERHFERKLQQLVAWRRTKVAAEVSEGAKGRMSGGEVSE